jgi:glycosyltransferase involved in cell wall biosynthesis
MSATAPSFGVAFTCVVPVWRGDDPGAFVAAMESVAASTVAPDAIVVAQDGPLPMELAADVERAVAACGAHRLVNPGPPGLHHNLNRAIEAVKTPYVARLDADDLNLPDRFAAQVDFARSHPEVAAFGGAIQEFWPDGRTRHKATPVTHEAILRLASWRNPINHMTAFFRRDAFLAAGGYPDIPLKEDYGLWLAMLARGERLANLPQVVVHARLGEDFHRRRAGLNNFASERALYRLKHGVPGLDHGASAMALALRSAALALPGPAGLAYWGVRR